MVTINSCLNVGFLVYKVEVQISMSRGYGVKIIGLTDRVVRESKHRILTALHFNSFKVSWGGAEADHAEGGGGMIVAAAAP